MAADVSSDPRYGAAHQAERARWAPLVAAGLAVCCETVCVNPGGRGIPPDLPGQPTRWHLAHTDDGQGYKGPAHGICNTSEAGRRGNPRGRRKTRRATAQTWMPTREWLSTIYILDSRI